MQLPRTLRNLFGRIAGNLPVKIKQGPNRGLWWTLYPWTGYWRGAHIEEDSIKTITGLVGPGDVCLDLGAHFGFYTLLMARQSSPSGRVYAFEPEPSNFAKLRRHVALNRLGDRCFLFNAGVSEQDGDASMYAGGGDWAPTAHFRYSDEAEFKAKDAITVRTVRIDSLVEKGKVDCPRFIKMDVEGHAAPALEGARETIASSRPHIVISTHGPDESAGIARFAERLGYKTLWSVSGRPWSAAEARPDEAVLLAP
jgi:FkbM family methyltransferase